MTAPLPEWVKALKPSDWYYDGRPIRLPRDQAAWDNLNWSAAWVDLGPSPVGNAGPYWHVPVYDDQDGMLGSVHRLYPKVLASKWFGLIRQAINEATMTIEQIIDAASRVRDRDQVVRMVQIAIDVERERCAKLCETHAIYHVGTAPTKLVPSATGEPVGHLFAAAIRNSQI